MEELKKCPLCGSREIGQGKQSGHATWKPLHKFWTTGSEVIADICSDCGYIISMKVSCPGKFKPKGS